MLKLATSLTLAVALVAGCGGSASVYDPAATRECLSAAGADVGQATKGESVFGREVLYRVEPESAGADVLFYETGKAAKLSEKVAKELSIGIIEVKRNVVIEWTGKPDDSDQTTVIGCLRSSS